jgi:hypothetical protein
MNVQLIEDIANAVLYEGYMLYPYRASAIKNRQRWNFGVVYPPGYDVSSMQTECLGQGGTGLQPVLGIRVRFLQLTDPQSQKAIAREVVLARLPLSNPVQHTFSFPPVQGSIEIKAGQLGSDLFKIQVSIFNTVPFDGSTREDALMQSLVSTHTILSLEDGEFISLIDPPDALRETAAQCQNVGTWPVLVGQAGQRDALLSSPIILYDYPQIAPESAGTLFDGTEIDEILTLRIMTLTDQEKAEMGRDELTRQILERTESMLPEQLMKMHGVLRERGAGGFACEREKP